MSTATVSERGCGKHIDHSVTPCTSHQFLCDCRTFPEEEPERDGELQPAAGLPRQRHQLPGRGGHGAAAL